MPYICLFQLGNQAVEAVGQKIVDYGDRAAEPAEAKSVMEVEPDSSLDKDQLGPGSVVGGNVGAEGKKFSTGAGGEPSVFQFGATNVGPGLKNVSAEIEAGT
ncbi:hypothetical protein C8J56DRAFT_879849 [Mycena floridula]|nr:hypothetical protein C8J56DRAFT_879849 [Mycena floridula]